jgi:hypothetical protein
MDAQSNNKTATLHPALSWEPVADRAATAQKDGMDELLEAIEAELALQEHAVPPEDHTMEDFEQSVRSALEGIDPELLLAPDEVHEPVAAAVEAVDVEDAPHPGEQEPQAADPFDTTPDEPIVLVAEPADRPEYSWDQTYDAAVEPLEAVELELALQNQNLVSLGFEESIHTALSEIGGEMLFQMRLERQDCQRIAAVRVGQGNEQQLALVIMPPGGGLMRVEPVEQSHDPLATIARSYAGLVDSFRAAA